MKNRFPVKTFICLYRKTAIRYFYLKALFFFCECNRFTLFDLVTIIMA
jgi:hypothetical protein